MGVRVEVAVTDNDKGGLCLECQRCEHVVEVRGQGPGSYRYGYVQLKQTCPEGEENYYKCDDEPEN